MTAKPVEFIQPPNNLRMKQKMAGVSMSFDSSVLDQAEASIRRCSEDFFVSIAEDLAKMQKRYEAAMLDPESRPIQIEEIHAIGQSLAGQGSSFNYPLVTALASQLCHYIEDHVFPLAGVRGVTDSEMEIVKVHMEAMRLIVQQKMEGDGGATGQKIVTGLGLVIKKVTGTAPAP
jgi:hypothetical protein